MQNAFVCGFHLNPTRQPFRMPQPLEKFPLSVPADAIPVSATGARVTLRDIARHLGISHVAVSLALRDRPGISDDLRRKVKDTAEKLGYRPDPALAALNNYRVGRLNRPVQAALGWISFWRNPATLHAYREADAYWKGAKHVAEKHGYQLYEFFPDAKTSLAAVERVMRARNIEGLLLAPPEPSLAEEFPAMDWSQFSIVRYGHGLNKLPFHLVTSAQASNTVMAIRQMRQLGYKRIGFVSSHYSSRRMQFLNGYLRAREDFPAIDQLPHLNFPEISRAEDKALLAGWLDAQRPDAIFSNISALRSLLTELGVDIPGKLGLAVTSVQDGGADSGIDQSPFEIGKIGCETLISLLMHGHRGFPEHPREVLVEGRWVNGSTLPPRG